MKSKGTLAVGIFIAGVLIALGFRTGEAIWPDPPLEVNHHHTFEDEGDTDEAAADRTGPGA